MFQDHHPSLVLPVRRIEDNSEEFVGSAFNKENSLRHPLICFIIKMYFVIIKAINSPNYGKARLSLHMDRCDWQRPLKSSASVQVSQASKIKTNIKKLKMTAVLSLLEMSLLSSTEKSGYPRGTQNIRSDCDLMHRFIKNIRYIQIQ